MSPSLGDRCNGSRYRQLSAQQWRLVTDLPRGIEVAGFVVSTSQQKRQPVRCRK
jgi:hypothetical protein